MPEARTSEHTTLHVQPEMHKLERTDSKDHMHGLWWRWSASLLHSNTLRPCKAALPISGNAATRCWVLERENIQSHPLVINNYPPLHLPPRLSTALSRVRNSEVISARGTFTINPDTRGIHLIENLGHFLLVEEDQKWKVRLPRCIWGPRDTCETEIKGPPFLQQNILDPLFHFSLHIIITYRNWWWFMWWKYSKNATQRSDLIQCRDTCAATLPQASVQHKTEHDWHF